VLALLRRDRVEKAPAPEVVLVLADPVFGVDDARVRQRADTPHAPPLAFLPPGLFRDAARAGRGDGVPRLPSTLAEAEAVIAAAPPGRGRLASGFSASRATAAGDEPGRYRIVHFATHGIIDSQHPELSGILLSFVNAGGGQENGFLQLHDIYNLRLSADLVVLSSCSTALGKEMRGEGVVGLTRGFMYAGADGVVATLWKVDDKASAELMKHFYGAMLRDGLAPAAALKAAKEKLWRQGRWRSPFYWAAFVLQGEYGQRIRDEQGRGPAAAAAVVTAAVLLLLLWGFLRRFPQAARRAK
jgi:CHAT domain-containing protein